ncbi:MAG: hypothetical protein J5858_00220 [Lentisphaeria bacterium]|nr:hypothetical protein [Lentisphaeria bacterium]
MADIGTDVYKKKKQANSYHSGFSHQKQNSSTKITECRNECRTSSNAAPCSAPAYLRLPSLEKVQKEIIQTQDIRTPCRILAALDRIFPLNCHCMDRNDPVSLLIYCMQKWLESFMPSDVLKKLDLEQEICPASEADIELFDGLKNEEYLFHFGIRSFVDRYFPLEKVIAQYNKLNPQLGKYLLKLLSDCPFYIGTPENVYELISYVGWCGENDHTEILQDHYQDCMEGGCSEEEADAIARESIIMEYSEVEENFPEWSFKRDQRIEEYRGIIPDELKKIVESHKRYKKMKTTLIYPSFCYPGIVAPLDQQSFEFSCEAINRVSHDHIQSGGSYTISTLGWSFSPYSMKRMIQMFREIHTTLEYFGACVEFLLNNEKEYANA